MSKKIGKELYKIQFIPGIKYCIHLGSAHNEKDDKSTGYASCQPLKALHPNGRENLQSIAIGHLLLLDFGYYGCSFKTGGDIVP